MVVRHEFIAVMIDVLKLVSLVLLANAYTLAFNILQTADEVYDLWAVTWY